VRIRAATDCDVPLIVTHFASRVRNAPRGAEYTMRLPIRPGTTPSVSYTAAIGPTTLNSDSTSDRSIT
jgi:hypothetical protein